MGGTSGAGRQSFAGNKGQRVWLCVGTKERETVRKGRCCRQSVCPGVCTITLTAEQHHQARLFGNMASVPTVPTPCSRALPPCSRCLLQVARGAEGFSGRTLRKLPFLAHAAQDFPGGRCNSVQYLNALLAAVQREREDRVTLSEGGAT